MFEQDRMIGSLLYVGKEHCALRIFKQSKSTIMDTTVYIQVINMERIAFLNTANFQKKRFPTLYLISP